MLLTPRGTLCLEVVMFRNTAGVRGSVSDWSEWRSNKGAIAEAAESIWQIKLIEPHHILTAKPWVGQEVSDHEIMASDVVLTREHISDILWRVESHLGSIDHGLEHQKSKLAPIGVRFKISAVQKSNYTMTP